jgi:hypothetical protein
MNTAKLLSFCFTSAALLRAAGDITFSATIVPILYENCVSCHRPGEAAPFSLITYEDVAKRGALVATVTASRYMPPWHAVHGYGEFKGERRLTDAQIAAIGDWVKAGMPRGDGSKMPSPPKFTEGWHLGTPDLVFEMPAGFEISASGPDVYRNFVFHTGLKEDKWVRAVEFRPRARRVVHHALFAYVGHDSFRSQEGRDGQPGFSGSMAVGVAPGQANSGGLGGWAVGGGPQEFPEGGWMPLPKDSDFLLQLHFHPTGKPETERSLVGLYFADGPLTKRLASLELPALFGFGAGIDIPPGEANYAIRDSFRLPGEVSVLSAFAHAHYLGKEMKVNATLPDGSTHPLLWINDWDFNWQEPYQYKQPVRLPKGTRIDVAIRYDNSADNPRNPSNPPKRALWGEESFDEMGTVGLVCEIVNADEEAAIREALDIRVPMAIRAAGADGTLKRYLDHQAATRAAQ